MSRYVFSISDDTLYQAYATQFAPYPSPYLQGVSRMSMPSNYSEPSMLPPQTRRISAPGFGNYDGFSGIGSVMDLDPSTPIDEPPPPYPTNSMLVSPMSDILNSTLLRPDVGSITPSPLAPVPQRHNSLYQVLKHESQASPAQGTVSSPMSSIAHALELPEQPVRLVPPPRTPALRNRRGPTIGASETSLGVSQIASTSLAGMAVADARLSVPKLSTLPAAQVQVQPPVSCPTPPSAATMQAQNGSAVVTPLRGHTLAQSLPEVTTNDYDTLPRLRKVSTPLHPLVPLAFTNIYDSVLVAWFSPSLPCQDPTPLRKNLLPHRARSHPCHRARHLRLALRPRRRPHARATALSSQHSACLSQAVSAPCCGPSWLVSSVVGGRYSVAPCPAITWRTLVGKFSLFQMIGSFLSLLISGADRRLVCCVCRQCAKRSRRCEYPEMTWRGRGRKRSQSDAEESDEEEEEEEEDPPARRARSRRASKLR